LARKILLADDSVTAQNMGRRILMEAGYEVVTVNNGSAALKKIAEAKPDLIVLDVYMPGYGGLEVCQRIREAPETARIPVLLTVGKLEPFKADEVRRVRADAYIIKPFEASELLTALTKLEDKIVPQGQPYKPGRFAKAIAAVEESYTGKEFGNPETGWKDRLSIPPHAPKHQEPEPAASVGFRDFGRREEREATASNQESATPIREAEVPAREIVPAAFSAQGEEAAPRAWSGDAAEEVRSKAEEAAAPASEAIAGTSFTPASEAGTETAPEPSAVTEVEFAVAAEQVASGEPESSPYAFAAPEPMREVASADSAPSVTSVEPTSGDGHLGDEEVTAALASLAPANRDWDTAAIGFAAGDADKASTWTNEQVLATMAATAGMTPQYSGPRWIAEAVPIPEDESALILEQEMAKAYAAFAAVDAGRVSGDAWEPESRIAAGHSPEANGGIAEAASESSASSDFQASQPEEGTSARVWPAPVLGNAEGFAPAAAEMAQSAEPPLGDAVGSSPINEPKTDVQEEAAFAAAASAGAAEAVAGPDGPPPAIGSELAAAEGTAPAPAPGEQHHESELAAAWANWKHIRESVIGSELTPQVGDASAGFHEIRRKEPATVSPDSPAAASDGTEDEVNAIASIVDSVLADLKPKLMEEIAKKMGKDSKKK